MKTLTKDYRLVWSDKIILYGKYEGGETVTKHNTFECDTEEELNLKVIDLGFEVPKEVNELT